MATVLSMTATVNVNGRISGEKDALISVFDHGFLDGEGVYETLRTYSGRPFLYDRHIRPPRAAPELTGPRVPGTDEHFGHRAPATAPPPRCHGAEAYEESSPTPAIAALPTGLW